MGSDVDTPPMFLPTSRTHPTLEARPTPAVAFSPEDFSPSIRRTFLRQGEREELKDVVRNLQPAAPPTYTLPPAATVAR
jgi:hypothetical protein